MKLIKIKKIWHARIRDASGHTRTVTTRCTDKGEAKKAAACVGELEAAGRSARLTAEVIGRITTGKKVTVEKAIAAFEQALLRRRSPKTASNIISTLHTWANAMKVLTQPPASVGMESVDKWINDAESSAKASTRRVNLSALRTFFDYCCDEGWMVGNPAGKQRVSIRMNLLSHAQKETTERLPFTELEVKRLLDHANKKGLVFWEFAVLISWEIGLRLGDICNLEFECFNQPRRAVVWTDKRDKRVSVPISRQLEELVTLVPLTSDKYLFPEQRELNLDPKRRAILSIQFKRIAERCDIKEKSFHCLRHACITRWAKEGRSLESIGKDVGHANAGTTQAYVHP